MTSRRPARTKYDVEFRGQPPKGVFETLQGPVTLAIAILALGGNFFAKSWEMRGDVVTKAELVDAISGANKHSDDNMTKAFDHSDQNRLQTLNDMKTMQTDMKGIAVKQDLMFDAQRQIQQQLQQISAAQQLSTAQQQVASSKK